MRAIVLALLAVGCRHAESPPRLPVEVMPGPNGHPAALIDCRGGMRECLRVAGEICPTGYTDLARNTRVVGGRTISAATTSGKNTTVASRTDIEQETELFITCPNIVEQLRFANDLRRKDAEDKERRQRKRCGFTCPPGTSCPYLDWRGCYKPEYEVPKQ